MLNTYLAKNTVTGEEIHGTIKYISEKIGLTESGVRDAVREMRLAARHWKIVINTETKYQGYKKTCQICGNEYRSARNNSLYCSEECATIARHKRINEYGKRIREEKRKKEERRNMHKSIIKGQSVCKGCKYHVVKGHCSIFNGTCDYLAQTGHSRYMVEIEHGGVKADSCVGYEEGVYRERNTRPYYLLENSEMGL